MEEENNDTPTRSGVLVPQRNEQEDENEQGVIAVNALGEWLLAQREDR